MTRMLDAAGRALQSALESSRRYVDPADARILPAFSQRRVRRESRRQTRVNECLRALITNSNRYQQYLKRTEPEICRKKITGTLKVFDDKITSVKGLTAYKSSMEQYPSTESVPRLRRWRDCGATDATRPTSIRTLYGHLKNGQFGRSTLKRRSLIL